MTISTRSSVIWEGEEAPAKGELAGLGCEVQALERMSMEKEQE